MACTDDDGGEAAGAPGTTEGTAPASDADTGAFTSEQVDASIGELDDIVATVMDETGVPGVAVAVVYDDQVVYQQGYGVKSTETGDPVDPETIFQIASMSKPISSTIVAGLVGDGTFAWDDPIHPYAPELQLSDPWVTDHVTFADLFAHRSGLPGGPAGNDLEAIGFDRDTILARLRYIPLDPFRITYSYSNFGMTMGGVAAAQAADMTWEEAADQVLFEPAGMTSTSMRHEDYVNAEDRADIHVRVDGEWQPAFERQPDPQAPAGGVSSNVVDLARWMRLQLAEGSLDGTQIIDPDALDETHIPQVMARPPAPTLADPASFYGLGWNIETEPDATVSWNHSGAFSVGTATTVKLLPAEGFGVVALTNGEPIGASETIVNAYIEYLQTGDADIDGNLELWGERFSGLFGEPEKDWSDPPSNPAPARDPEAYVGTYANDYVGEVQVVRGEDGLRLLMGPEDRSFPMEHWDGDTFSILDAPELPDYRTSVTFAVDDEGRATEVTITAMDGAGQGTLTRVESTG